MFECHLEAPVYRQMAQRLKKLIKLEQDNVRLYHLCNKDVKRIEQMGIGRPVQLAHEFQIV